MVSISPKEMVANRIKTWIEAKAETISRETKRKDSIPEDATFSPSETGCLTPCQCSHKSTSDKAHLYNKTKIINAFFSTRVSTWSGRIPFTDLPKKPRDFKLLSDVGALSISPPSWQTEKRTLDLLSERYGVCHFYPSNGAMRLKQNLEVT